ncbi:MAG TPA: phage head closure protein [Veillonellaceae bacterium]|uniref:phage head closure protein n=1 Tax=Dialister hominis TaxID=2582419 RepID=UPI003521C075|nr:phage head closure protein [Veillonellaceae bacterium]
MRIGSMNKRLVLLKPKLKDDGYGGKTTDYEEAGKVWAYLYQADYKEMESLGTPMNREQLRFKIRPYKWVKRGWRVKYRGELYVVDSVDDSYKDSMTLILRRYDQGV